MKIIMVENYKMFKGVLRISPKCPNVEPFELKGSFLYKPDSKCWYGNGSSFTAEICEIVEDFENV